MTPEERAREKARDLINIVRMQNWKNGGVLMLDDDHAVERATTALLSFGREEERRGAEAMRERAAAVADDETDSLEGEIWIASRIAADIRALPVSLVEGE